MGQYFIAVNLDKREFIHPHRFGDGLKFYEMCGSSSGVLAALAHLLRQSDDPVSKHDIVGSWANCRVTIVGDYDSSKLYETVMDEFKDVSFDVFRAMVDDKCTRDTLETATRWRRREDLGNLSSDPDERAFYREVFDEPKV